MKYVVIVLGILWAVFFILTIISIIKKCRTSYRVFSFATTAIVTVVTIVVTYHQILLEEAHLVDIPESQQRPELSLSNHIETVDKFVVGWGDSSGGRTSYTLDELNANPDLLSGVVFNSISSSIPHEFNFVGAREVNGKPSAETNRWYQDAIVAKEDKTYVVRLYANNNGTETAEDVAIRFVISNPTKV